jgi:hypothetical protein
MLDGVVNFSVSDWLSLIRPLGTFSRREKEKLAGRDPVTSKKPFSLRRPKEVQSREGADRRMRETCRNRVAQHPMP